jgi:hypothetical protein
MMDSEVLTELLVALPEWATRLRDISTRFSDFGSGDDAAVNPTPELTAPPPQQAGGRRGRYAPPSLPEDEVVPKKPDSGTKKLYAKPGSTKAKFSSITGPDIYYDGEAQMLLFDCWTALNSKRGVLRKEMMTIRRKKVLTLPTANYGYSDSDDELEADDASDKEETEEDRLRKAEEERQRLEQLKKKEEDERRSKVLEFIDGCLDKAAGACESAATVWLRGEGCVGHVVFITARMAEAVLKIREELGIPEVQDDGYDEGFGEEVEREDAEEELHHKKPSGGSQRDVAIDDSGAAKEGRTYHRPSSPQPVEVAG